MFYYIVFVECHVHKRLPTAAPYEHPFLQSIRGRVRMVDLRLPIQSVPITTDVSSNLDQGNVYNFV